MLGSLSRTQSTSNYSASNTDIPLEGSKRLRPRGQIAGQSSSTVSVQSRVPETAKRSLKSRRSASQHHTKRIKSLDSQQIIRQPKETDILFGRGGKSNTHKGNKTFVSIVHEHKPEYNQASKAEKSTITADVVAQCEDKGMRFLRKNKGKNSGWSVETNQRAIRKKTSQCLREKTLKRFSNLNSVQPSTISIPIKVEESRHNLMSGQSADVKLQESWANSTQPKEATSQSSDSDASFEPSEPIGAHRAGALTPINGSRTLDYSANTIEDNKSDHQEHKPDQSGTNSEIEESFEANNRVHEQITVNETTAPPHPLGPLPPYLRLDYFDRLHETIPPLPLMEQDEDLPISAPDGLAHPAPLDDNFDIDLDLGLDLGLDLDLESETFDQ